MNFSDAGLCFLRAVNAPNAKTTSPIDANQLFEDLIDACPAVDCYWPLNFVSETKSKLIEAVGKLNKIHVFDRWEQIIAPKHMSLAFLDEFNYELCS